MFIESSKRKQSSSLVYVLVLTHHHPTDGREVREPQPTPLSSAHDIVGAICHLLIKTPYVY